MRSPTALPFRRARVRARRPHCQERPLRVFLSFSHLDGDGKEMLCKHLSSLALDGVIRLWDDRQLPPGAWSREVRRQIRRADVVLLLVSSDFISSRHCMAEARLALEREEAGQCTTIPIIWRECDWVTRPWARLETLPTDCQAVTSHRWHSKDEALTDVARRLRGWLSELRRTLARSGSRARSRTSTRRLLSSPLS